MKGARPHVERAPLNERGAPSCRESTLKWKGRTLMGERAPLNERGAPSWGREHPLMKGACLVGGWWFPPFLHAAKSWWPLDPLAVIHVLSCRCFYFSVVFVANRQLFKHMCVELSVSQLLALKPKQSKRGKGVLAAKRHINRRCHLQRRFCLKKKWGFNICSSWNYSKGHC